MSGPFAASLNLRELPPAASNLVLLVREVQSSRPGPAEWIPRLRVAVENDPAVLLNDEARPFTVIYQKLVELLNANNVHFERLPRATATVERAVLSSTQPETPATAATATATAAAATTTAHITRQNHAPPQPAVTGSPQSNTKQEASPVTRLPRPPSSEASKRPALRHHPPPPELPPTPPPVKGVDKPNVQVEQVVHPKTPPVSTRRRIGGKPTALGPDPRDSWSRCNSSSSVGVDDGGDSSQSYRPPWSKKTSTPPKRKESPTLPETSSRVKAKTTQQGTRKSVHGLKTGERSSGTTAKSKNSKSATPTKPASSERIKMTVKRLPTKPAASTETGQHSPDPKADQKTPESSSVRRRKKPARRSRKPSVELDGKVAEAPVNSPVKAPAEGESSSTSIGPNECNEVPVVAKVDESALDYREIQDYEIEDDTRSLLQGFLDHCKSKDGSVFWLCRRDSSGDSTDGRCLKDMDQRTSLAAEAYNCKYWYLGEFLDAYCDLMKSWLTHPKLSVNASTCLYDEDFLPRYLRELRKHVDEIKPKRRLIGLNDMVGKGILLGSKKTKVENTAAS